MFFERVDSFCFNLNMSRNMPKSEKVECIVVVFSALTFGGMERKSELLYFGKDNRLEDFFLLFCGSKEQYKIITKSYDFGFLRKECIK